MHPGAGWEDTLWLTDGPDHLLEPIRVDDLLDALECVAAVPLDAFGDDPAYDSSGTDGLVLGRCRADGYAMARSSETGYTWRPWPIGRGVPCPADGETYIDTDGVRKSMGLCREQTFEPWKAGKR